MSNSFWSCGLKHTRAPCPLPYLRVFPSSCPLNQCCHAIILSSVTRFFLQSFPASWSFPLYKKILVSLGPICCFCWFLLALPEETDPNKCIKTHIKESTDCILFYESYSFKSCWAQKLNCVQLFETPWPGAHQASLSFTFSWNLCKLMSIKSMMSSNHLILWQPLLLLLSVFPSIRIFSSESFIHIR